MASAATQNEGQAAEAGNDASQGGPWDQSWQSWGNYWPSGWQSSAWNGYWGSYSGYWTPRQWWSDSDSWRDWRRSDEPESGENGSQPGPSTSTTKDDMPRRASASTDPGETMDETWSGYERRGSIDDDAPASGTKTPKVGKDSIPEYDGSYTMREYQRRVRLFEISTSIDPSYRAQKLMEKLSGNAWLATESIPLESLRHPQGVERLLQHLWSELEPLEFLRIFSTLADFYKNFRRARGQEFVAYDMSFRMHLQRLDEINAGIDGVTKAYWFLEKAGLSAELRKQVVAAAGGQYDYQKLRSAVMAIVPQVSKEEENHHPQPSSRMWKRGTARVHATTEPEEAEEPEQPPEEEEGDTARLEAELEVLMTHAARKRAAIEQSRGFKTPESTEAREKRIKDMKARMPCSACKAHGLTVYGHWHSDPACPYRSKSTSTSKQDPPKNGGAKVLAVVEDELSDSEYEPDEEGIFMTTLQDAGDNWCANALVERPGTMDELRCLALSDTCCARSVAGEKWMNQHVKHVHGQGLDTFVVLEKRPFRFGAGPRIYSAYSVVMPLCIEGAKLVPWIRVSVVPQGVPLLLSKAALKSLGAVLDLAGGELELSALGTTTELVETSTGLCGFRINHQVQSQASKFPSEALLTQDVEVEVSDEHDSYRNAQNEVAQTCILQEEDRSTGEGNSVGIANVEDSDRNAQNEVAPSLESVHSDPEKLAASLMFQQDFTFSALKRLVGLIPLDKKKIHRGINGGKGKRIQGMVAGIWTHGSQVGVAKTAQKWPRTITYINRFMKHHGGNQWSSFVLLKNVKTKIHKDNHNTPGSMVKTMTFGDFSGGEVWIASQGEQERVAGSTIVWAKDCKGVRKAGYLVDTYEKPFDLDPKVEHATRPWKGDRWCLSFYSSRGAIGANQRCRRQLKKLEFPLARYVTARTFGITQDTVESSLIQGPHESREDNDSEVRRTPQQSHFSDSIACVPSSSIPDHGSDPCSETQGGVHECHRRKDQASRDRAEGARCHSVEGDLGSSEAQEEGASTSIELEAEGPGGPKAVIPRGGGSGSRAPKRLALGPLGESEAHHGNFHVGGDGQGDRSRRGPQRSVRRGSPVRELCYSHGGSQEPPHPGGILGMHEVSSLPDHAPMGVCESTSGSGSTRVRHQGGGQAEVPCRPEAQQGPFESPQGTGQEANESQRGPGLPFPPQRENAEGRSAGKSRNGGFFGRLMASSGEDGCSGDLFGRRNQVQHESHQGGDGRDHWSSQGKGRGQEVRLGPSETDASHGDFPKAEYTEHEDGPKVPLSPAEVHDRIARGQARRAYMKKGMVRRFLGNAKTMAMSVLIATAAAIGASAQCVPQFAQVRPDVLEIFAGRAQVTQSFARWGWYAARPIDIKWGDDLCEAEQRAQLLSWIDQNRPRLIIVSYPCKHWSLLTNMQYGTPQEKRRLQKLRQRDSVLLEFVEQVFARQIDRGDDALAENPLSSRSFVTPPMKRVLCHPKVYSAVSHGCRHGVINAKTKLPLLKPTMWVSTSPEICDELAKRCKNEQGGEQHVHGMCMGGKEVTEKAGVYTKSIARSICRGYVRTLRRKDPGRIRKMLRSVLNRIKRAEEHAVIKDLRWSERTASKALARWSVVFAADQPSGNGQSSDAPMIPPVEDPKAEDDVEMPLSAQQPGEGVAEHRLRSGLSSDGISFEVPQGRKLSEGIKQGLRKAHCNLGHPSKSDLERFLRLGGAKQEVIEAVSWMRCVSCAHSMRPTTHRAASVPPSSVTFADEVQLDCICIHDNVGDSHWFLSIVDRATSFHMLELLRDHSPSELHRAFDRAWSKWAGVPLRVSVDMEGGFAGEDFWEKVSQAGTSLSAIAGTAHWQAGKVERHNAIIKDMLRKTIQCTQPSGREAMRVLSREVAFAKNSLVREHGWSPAALVFGKEPRVFGELYSEGNPASYHLEVGTPESDVAVRMRYRYHAKLEFIRSQARHMLMKTAHQRTRRITNPVIGQLVFFWRGESSRRRENQSKWVGPGFVVGLQGANAWVACGGRCFLVAGEHLREVVGDEKHFGDPEIQKAIALFKKLPKEATYENLVGQEGPSNVDMDMEAQPLIQDVTEEMEVDDKDDLGLPENVKSFVGKSGWHQDAYSNPVLVTHKAWAMRTPESRYEGFRFPYRSTWARVEGEWRRLEREVKWAELENPHELIPSGPAAILITVFQGRTRKEMCLEDVPLGLKRRKEDKSSVVHAVSQGNVVAKNKLKRMLDKEIPFDCIPEADRELYKAAEDKEWDSWLQYDSCEILSLEESARVEKEEKSRILPSRYVFRNKHAGLVDEKGQPLPVKAKARLCLQGHLCPDSLTGQVQVDSPTIERVSTMLFLHLVASYGWTKDWFVGDISNAFLQGAPLVGKAPMYMRPPKQGLRGVMPGQLLKLLKPVYGRPDAPRAWYEELARILCQELHFEKSFVDPAMFMLRNPSGKLVGLMIVHVDDVMVCHDGSPFALETVERLRKRFPFGTWQRVCEQSSGISYCGKEIKVVNREGETQITLAQNGFIDGRLQPMEVPKCRKAQPESCATDEERTNYRSIVGSLQWLVTQSRPDLAFEVNQLQKRVSDLRVHDLLRANQAVREVVQHRMEIVFKNLGPDAEMIAYTDAGLYSSVGVELHEREVDDLLQSGRDKRLVYSQKGAMVGFVKRGSTELKGQPTHLNIVDWKSSTNKRVIESSFSGETHAALMGHGMARFCQVLLSEIRCGGQIVSAIDDDGWQQLTPVTMVTDCKSVYDTVHRDGQHISDKGSVVQAVLLRQLLSTRNSCSKARLLWVPTRHQLADGLTKSGRCKELRELLECGMTFREQAVKRSTGQREVLIGVNSVCCA